MKTGPYQLRVIHSLAEVPADSWNALLNHDAGPFLKHEFLYGLEECACVGDGTGWQIAHLLIEDVEAEQIAIVGAMPLYLKQHSYGEFVFDWAWAEAYAQNGLAYYPKALCAIPFTPVSGSRLLVSPKYDRQAIQTILLSALKSLVSQNKLSSAHILFPNPDEIAALKDADFLLRDSVQFHWHNQDYQDFEHFLANLTMKRRKNIRRERAQVSNIGMAYRHIPGSESTAQDWEFFFRCYANTYLEHRSQPYLNLTFFMSLAATMPENLHLIIATRDNLPIASSLLIVDKEARTAYGRYWGAIEHIPCLHFEVAYYQAIDYCIREGVQTFEGGAQGEHKMARGFTPTTLHSAHWIADPQFSKAIARFLEREHEGMAAYVDELEERNPLKSSKVQL